MPFPSREEELRRNFEGVDLETLGLTDIQTDRVRRFLGGRKVDEIAGEEGVNQASVRQSILSAEARAYRVKSGLPPMITKEMRRRK